MSAIRVAVVGAGFIGPVHVEALRRLGIDVAGVLGCDAEESESAPARQGLPRAYASLDEVLADETVQSVHLAVPNVLHYEMAKRVLQVGKHVICEKPLAMNSEQSAELVELAGPRGRSGGLLQRAVLPGESGMRSRIQRGELGDVVAINGSYVQDWLLYDTDYNWRVRGSGRDAACCC